MNRLTRNIVVAVAAIAIMVGAVGFTIFLTNKKEPPKEKPKPVVKNYVRVQEVAYSTVPVQIEAYGRVASSQQLDLVSEVGGRLLMGAIPLKNGQNFSKGQLLCRINNAEQILALQARKSSFLNILATVLPDIKIDFAEAYDKWFNYFESIDLEKDLPPLPEVASSKEKNFLAVKNVLGEFYNIKSQEENIKKYYVYAPYSGSIQNVNFEVGSVVNPGTNVATIIRTDRLELEVPILLSDINFIQVGTEAKVVEEGINGNSWTGKVIRKADFVDRNSQSINVYVRLYNNGQKKVYDGLFLKAIFPGRDVQNAMTLPRNAIRNKDQVFVVEEDQLRTKKVTVHKIMKEQVIIGGLAQGDKVVVEAPTNASENMPVEIITPAI